MVGTFRCTGRFEELREILVVCLELEYFTGSQGYTVFRSEETFRTLRELSDVEACIWGNNPCMQLIADMNHEMYG